MLSTCKKRWTTFVDSQLKWHFTRWQNLTTFSVSCPLPVPLVPPLTPSQAQRCVTSSVGQTGDFWWLLADSCAAHVAIICSKLKFISGQTLPQTTLTEKREYKVFKQVSTISNINWIWTATLSIDFPLKEIALGFAFDKIGQFYIWSLFLVNNHYVLP